MRKTLLIPALLLAGITCSSSLAAEVPQEVKSEFRQNIAKRDRLVRELAGIDNKAADAVAGGKAPMGLHAQQIELQDKVDLLQLRIETMAMRWNLEIPAPPKPGTAEMDKAANDKKMLEDSFQTGRDRTDDVLSDRCRQMLASIDYDSFLRRAN